MSRPDPASQKTIPSDDLACQLAADRSRLRKVYCLAAVLLLTALPALMVDLPLSQFFVDRVNHKPQTISPVAHRSLKLLHSLLVNAETFADGLGVGLILLAVYTLDRSNRRGVLRLAACAFGGGLLADLFKLLVARTRPAHFDFSGDVWSGFGDFLPLAFMDSAKDALNSSIQSFPSAHTATAAGLAVGLAWRFPHARGLFVFLAVLAGMQRIDTGSHYLSDVLAGAAIGCLAAALFLNPRGLGGWFDRYERKETKNDSATV